MKVIKLNKSKSLPNEKGGHKRFSVGFCYYLQEEGNFGWRKLVKIRSLTSGWYYLFEDQLDFEEVSGEEAEQKFLQIEGE